MEWSRRGAQIAGESIKTAHVGTDVTGVVTVLPVSFGAYLFYLTVKLLLMSSHRASSHDFYVTKCRDFSFKAFISCHTYYQNSKPCLSGT